MELEHARPRPWLLMIACLAVGLTPASSIEAETIYRCEGERGWVFQQSRCAPGGGGRFRLSPENRVGSPLRPGEERYVRQRIEARRSDTPNLGSIGPVEDPRPASDRRCLGKRQALERVERRLRQGYSPAQGDRLRRRREELAEFRRRFCD